MQSFYTTGKYLLQLWLFFGVLTAGILVGGVLLTFVKSVITMVPVSHDMMYLLSVVVPVFSLIVVLLSYYLYKQTLKKAEPEHNLSEKLKVYKRAALQKYVLTNAAAMFPVVAYFITDNLYLLAFAGMGILEMIRFRPSVVRIQKDLPLDAAERSALQNPEHPIEM